MSEPIAPWLNFTPQTFASAAEAGQKLRQSEEEIGIKRQELAQSAAQAAAELGYKQQALAEDQKQAQMQNLAKTEAAKQEALRTQTNDAIAHATKQAELGIAQGHLENNIKQTALAHQDRLAALTTRFNPLLENYKTINEAYLDAVKEYTKAAPDDPEKGEHKRADLARIALNYHNQAKDLLSKIQGQNTPAGAYAAATQTGTAGSPQGPPIATPMGTSGFTIPPPGGTSPMSTSGFATPAATAPGSQPLKFIRDKDGNLVLGDSQPPAQ